MIPPVLSCCGFPFRPDIIIPNGGCDSSAPESQITEKDPKFSRSFFSRETASAATASESRDPSVVVSASLETRTGTLTRNYRVLLSRSLSIALKPALNIAGI